MTNFLKLGILFFGISLLLFNCEQRELTEEMETVSIDNKYQPLNIDEVTDFMGDFKAKKYLEKSGTGIELNIDFSSLAFEKVEKSDVAIPAFEVTTKFTATQSKLFLVKVKDSIQSFLVNRKAFKDSDNDTFSGIIGVTDLAGNFINGYRVEEDVFIGQFITPKEGKKKNTSYRSKTDPVFDCWIYSGATLNEVVIRAYVGGGRTKGPRGLSFTSIRGGNQWTHGNSGGDNSNNSSGNGSDGNGSAVNVFPCDDPLHGCRDIEGNSNNIEGIIEIETPDDNYIYLGPKQNIPSSFTLSNGDKVNVTFITYTKDNKSSNQKVAIELINSMKFALEQANSNLSNSKKITSINVYATTNGHGTIGTSNHLKASAVDINSINGQRMALTGLTNQIKELQKAFGNFQHIRENFGPYFKHKFSKENPIGNQWNYNYPVGGHNDHIHISVRK